MTYETYNSITKKIAIVQKKRRQLNQVEEKLQKQLLKIIATNIK